MEIIQYNIVLVNLDPTVGSEIKKTRPCVVISPDEMNKYINTIVYKIQNIIIFLYYCFVNLLFKMIL